MKRSLKCILKLIIPVMLFANITLGQNIFPPDPVKKKIQATRIIDDIKIDGILD